MGKHDERVRDAQAEFAAASAVVDFGRWFVVYADGERISAPAMFERARMALREAVILQEANTWHDAGGAGGERG